MKILNKIVTKEEIKEDPVYYVALAICSIAIIVVSIFTIISSVKIITWVVNYNLGTLPQEEIFYFQKGQYNKLLEIESYQNMWSSIITTVIAQLITLIVMFQFSAKAIWGFLKVLGKTYRYLFTKIILKLLMMLPHCIRWTFRSLIIPLCMSISIIGILIAVPLGAIILFLGAIMIFAILFFSALILSLPVLVASVIFIFSQAFFINVYAYILLITGKDSDLILCWFQAGIKNGFKGNNLFEYNKNEYLEMPFYCKITIDDLLGKKQSEINPNIWNYDISAKPKDIAQLCEVCEELNIKDTLEFNKAFDKAKDNNIEMYSKLRQAKLTLKKRYEEMSL